MYFLSREMSRDQNMYASIQSLLAGVCLWKVMREAIFLLAFRVVESSAPLVWSVSCLTHGVMRETYQFSVRYPSPIVFQATSGLDECDVSTQVVRALSRRSSVQGHPWHLLSYGMEGIFVGGIRVVRRRRDSVCKNGSQIAGSQNCGRSILYAIYCLLSVGS